MGTETKTEGKKTMTTNAEQNQKAVMRFGMSANISVNERSSTIFP